MTGTGFNDITNKWSIFGISCNKVKDLSNETAAMSTESEYE